MKRQKFTPRSFFTHSTGHPEIQFYSGSFVRMDNRYGETISFVKLLA